VWVISFGPVGNSEMGRRRRRRRRRKFVVPRPGATLVVIIACFLARIWAVREPHLEAKILKKC
jgi:hypothetical protein